MKMYKVISKENKAMNGGSFDYSDYLPKGKHKGKWTPKINNVVECKKGYHVTPYPCMWMNSENNKVFLVETKGLVENDSVGVVDKFVCESIRLVEEVDVKIDNKFNTGHMNSGYKNSGYRNTGDMNTGNMNSGYMNSGNRNTGDMNSGNRNTGYMNSGNRNTGDMNTGDRNSGNWNTGNRNAGDENAGNWNASNMHVGCFNTKPPKYVELFNKPIEKEIYDTIDFPEWLYVDSLSHECFRKAFNEARDEELQRTVELPNFDYDVFEEVTGISKQDFKNRKIKVE